MQGMSKDWSKQRQSATPYPTHQQKHQGFPGGGAPQPCGVWINSSLDVVGKNTSRGVVGGTLSKLTKTKDNCAVPDVPNHSSQGLQLVLGWSSQPFGIMLVNKVGGVVFGSS